MTKEAILKKETEKTLNINEGSPLHDAVMRAMEIYKNQELSKLHQPTVISSVCECGEDRIGETKLWCCNHCGNRCEEF